MTNRFVAAGDGLPNAPVPCTLPDDTVATALKGLAWVRFYENWPGSFWLDRTVVSSGPVIDVMVIANAILEAEAGIPTALHVDAGGAGVACPALPRNISRPGPLGGPIEFWIASYLIVAGPGSTLSLSNNWFDADFCWRPELDVVFGTPVGPPVRTGLCTWARNFTRSIVAINVSAGRAGRWTCFRDAMQRMGTATGLVANTQRHVLYNIVGVFKKVYEMNHDLLILYHPVVRMLRRTCA